jgi:hypothetical protein
MIRARSGRTGWGRSWCSESCRARTEQGARSGCESRRGFRTSLFWEAAVEGILLSTFNL